MPMSQPQEVLLDRKVPITVPAARSKTYAPAGTPPKQARVEVLPLTRLPSAMRKMGWDTAAALMQRWFDSPAWQMPESWKDKKIGGPALPEPTQLPSAQVDETIVRMDWAMRFARCQEAMTLARARSTNNAAIGELKSYVRTFNWDGKTTLPFGDRSWSTRQLDQYCQVNIAQLGSKYLDTLDDMFGALGMATLKVAVIGQVSRAKDGQREFTMTHRGYYLRDTYDFNGFQPLGIWTGDRVLSKLESAELAHLPMGPLRRLIIDGPFAAVSNSDFRAYRDKQQRGGDFIVFSDVLWEPAEAKIPLGVLE